MQWCQECILWKEAAEPGILTAAAPGTELAPDEDPDVCIPKTTQYRLRFDANLDFSRVMVGATTQTPRLVVMMMIRA